MSESILDKLNQIKKFTEVDGNPIEQEAAKRKLEVLLKKYDLKLSDLDPDGEKENYMFKYTYAEEQTIIMQVIMKLTDNPKQGFYHYKNKKKELFARDLYEWQYKEAKVEIDWHIRQFRKERKAKLKALKSAYIYKHNLYPATPAEESEGESGLTREEIREILRTADSLENKSYTKQLAENI